MRRRHPKECHRCAGRIDAFKAPGSEWWRFYCTTCQAFVGRRKVYHPPPRKFKIIRERVSDVFP